MNTPVSEQQANFFESLFAPEPINFTMRPGSTLQEFLEESGLWARMHEDPLVVSVNGREIMQAEYEKIVLNHSDVVIIQQFPRGPAFAAFMYWFAIAAMVVSAIYILTMPEPGLPETADIKEGSPTYSLSAKGNRYRPGTKGPILYGRLRIVPDFDQPLFSTYDTNNDQTLHMIFRITQGIADVDLSSAKFEDTPLSNFQDVETEVLLPGQVPTIFPAGVIESNEISNIELLDPATIGYVVNDVNTEVNKIGIDLSSPSLYVQNKQNGELSEYSVTVVAQAQKLQANSNGTIGGWFNIGTMTLSGDDQDALRRSWTFEVPVGRYQVRLDRSTAKDDSQYVADKVYWLGLKGYLYNADDISPCTRLALSIRSSQQLGNKALTDMSIIAARKLPIWNPGDGWQTEHQTNSIGWALADLCRNAYAGNRSDLNYDLNKCYQLDLQLTPLGHEFNAYFDTEGVSVWDALIKAGTPGRITPIDHSGFFKFVRDERKFTPVQSFTMRNIVKGSFRIEHSTVVEETADSVVVVFQDEDNDYRERRIPCELPDSPALRPREVQLFGVTNATRAKELGMFMAATNRYRRRIIPFSTGVEGRIPFYGDQILISHILLGQEGTNEISGEVNSWDGTELLTLSEKWPEGRFTTPYIVLIGLDGRPLPPTPALRESDFVARLPDFTTWSELSFENGYKRTMYLLGDGTTFSTKAKVKSIARKGQDVEIQAFVDDDRVYDYGDDVIPPDPEVINPPQSAAPVLSELQAAVTGTVEEPIVNLSWSLKNADKTEIEFSVDGSTYIKAGVGFVLTNKFVHRPDPTKLSAGIVYYRLAATNLFRGPWVPITVDTSNAAFNPPLNPTNLRLRETFNGPVLKVEWDSDSQRHFIQIIVNPGPSQTIPYSTTVDGTQWDFAGALAAEYGVGRSFTVRVYAIGANGKTSLGYTQLAVSNPAPPILNNLTVESFFGIASVTFDFPTAVTDLAGISVWKSATNGFTPSSSTLVVDRTMNPVIGVPLDEEETAYIRIATVDVWGYGGLNYSGQYTVTGKGIDLTPIYDALEELAADLSNLQGDLATVAADLALVETELNQAETDINGLEGKFPITTVDISNNAITAPKIAANSIEADKIVANAVTTGKLAALAVTAEKIAALAITADKIAANAVSADKIAANSISSDKIVANAVTSDKIAALAITAGKIAAGAITSDKISVADLSAISASMGTITAGLLRTTASTTAARLEIDSNGNFPLWVGANAKDSTNGEFFYDKTTQSLVIREPSTGRRFEFQPSSSMPFWYGSGTKTSTNAFMYYSTALGRLVLRNFQAESGFVTELQSNNWVNNSTGWKLFSDGSAQFNNLVISRPNVVASGTLSIGGAGSPVNAHFQTIMGNWSGSGFGSIMNCSYRDPGSGVFAWYPDGGPGGIGGEYVFTVDVPNGTFTPDEVGNVNGRMIIGQAVVVNSEYYYTGSPPAGAAYAVPCSVETCRTAQYSVSGSFVRLRISVWTPTAKASNVYAIQIRGISWALSAFT